MKVKLLILFLMLLIPILSNNIGYFLFKNNDNKEFSGEINDSFDIKNYVLNSFKKYNKNINTKTVNKFIEVCDSFNCLYVQ